MLTQIIFYFDEVIGKCLQSLVEPGSVQGLDNSSEIHLEKL